MCPCWEQAISHHQEHPSNTSQSQLSSGAVVVPMAHPGSRGVRRGCRAGGWRQCSGLVTSLWLPFPWDCSQAGQTWTPASPAAAVVCRHQGSLATAHVSFMLPTGAGMRLLHPPCTLPGVPCLGTALQATKSHGGQAQFSAAHQHKRWPCQLIHSSYWEQSLGTLGATGGGCA